MSDLSGTPGGLFAALKGISATLLASGKTRLELFANELEEEKLRLVQSLVMVLGMVACFGLFLLVAILFLTALFWEARVWILGISAVLLLLVGMLFMAGYRRAAQRSEGMFAASLAELEEDLRQLKAAAGHDAQSE